MTGSANRKSKKLVKLIATRISRVKLQTSNTPIAFDLFSFLDKVQNITIEERVSLLELQVTDLDQDVNFLFDQQVIQDERLLGLEQTDNQVVLQLIEVNVDLQGKITKFCELNFYCRFFFQIQFY